jgi:hypothetical protein
VRSRLLSFNFQCVAFLRPYRALPGLYLFVGFQTHDFVVGYMPTPLPRLEPR